MKQREAAMRYTVGDLLIDVEGERVSRDGQAIPLPQLSFDLLLVLVRAAPALVPVRRLLEEVWPGVIVGPETVSQRIKLLREVLGDSVDQPRYLAGVRGKGYRIVAPVAAAQMSSAQQAGPVMHANPARAHSRRLLLGGGLLVLATMVALGWMSRAAWLPGDAQASTAATSSSSRVLIAVLPLDNMSPDADNAFFADGLHEEIISALARQAPALEVISRTTMLTFRQPAVRSVGGIHDALGATHVLEGSVRREADQLRLSLQLVDARTDTSVWTKVYDRTLVSTLTLQSEVATDVAAQLSLRLPAQSRAPPTRNPLAYDFYLKALLLRGDAATLAAPPAAVRAFDEMLARAIGEDPGFAHAYAERVAARINRILLDGGDEADVQAIRADLETAERLAPGDPKVMAARALYLSHVEQDHAQAVAAFDAAERAGLADPVWIKSKMWPLQALGRFEDALALIQRCVALDPKNIELLLRYAENLASSGRPEESLRMLELGLTQAPDDLLLLATHAATIWRRTGHAEELQQVVTSQRARALAQLDRGIVLTTDLNLARIQGQFDDMQRQLDAAHVAVVRTSHPGVGLQPVARLQGWVSLLRKDSVRAARAGRELLQHLHAMPETRWNRSFRRLLAAEAHTFLGQRPAAMAAAREALQLATSFSRRQTEFEVAVVFAWNGADMQAVALLEQMTSTPPMLGPADVARDPLFTLPLETSPPYHALADRLEAQIRAATSGRMATRDLHQ